MTVEITNCLCCNAPYLNGAYQCDCRQDRFADCCTVDGKLYCKNCCPCSHPATIHPLDLPLTEVWQEAVKEESK